MFKYIFICLSLIGLGTISFAEGQDKSHDLERIYDLGGRYLVDGTLEATGALQADRYFEVIGISTPTTPNSNHSRLFLNNTTKAICSIFDTGATSCFNATLTGVTAGLGLTGGGATGNITVGLSTPIAVANLPNTYTSSVTFTNALGSYDTYNISAGSFTARNIASGNQCVQANSSGNLLGTGSACTPNAGRVVQISSFCVTAASTTNTSVFANTNLLVSITPTSSSSYIRITATGELTTNGGANCYATLARGTTNLAGANGMADEDNAFDMPASLFLYDNPATTSATTYRVQIRSSSAVVCNWNRISITSCITLEEISQ